ncbi:endolytic transglycosylase MltG [candidate division WOR-3 bacterium]|nr:endolytic transglycosylase MltG [candidate division WOR-3 bacterium]
MKKRYIAFLILIIISIIWWQPLNIGRTEITIPEGSTAQEIAGFLHEDGIVRDQKEFLFWLRISGQEKHLKSGTYTLCKYKNPLFVIGELSDGGYSDISVTIPEGATIRETACILAAQGLVNQDAFVALCARPDFVRAFGIRGKTLEGYLFPDTYSFSRSQNDSQIVAIFVSNFKKHSAHFDIENADSLHRIVILASLVEKEAKFEGERPIIARVFLNRIQQNRPLESCATVLYALKIIDFEKYHEKKQLLERDLRVASPFNTYTNLGLPPGPICSPGERSLAAAVSPADVDYLYFVSMGNGRHHFSLTYKEHIAAKEQYREKN